MAIQFRADNIGSLLRPPELLQARMALREGRMNEIEVREIEDRSILTALAMQQAAGVQIFTDGEYRRDIFTADITKALDGLVPGKPVVKFEWRGKGKQLAEESKEGNLQYIVGGKLRRKGRFTPNEAPFLKQHAPGPFKVCTPAAMQHAIMRYRPGVTDKFYPTVHDMLQDVAAIMREEVQALIDEGAAYVQLDAPSYSNFFDQNRREVLRQSGINLDASIGRGDCRRQRDDSRASNASPMSLSVSIFAAATSAAPGAPRAVTSQLPRRPSARSRWIVICWSSIVIAPAASSLCASCPKARRWCWA